MYVGVADAQTEVDLDAVPTCLQQHPTYGWMAMTECSKQIPGHSRDPMQCNNNKWTATYINVIVI